MEWFLNSYKSGNLFISISNTLHTWNSFTHIINVLKVYNLVKFICKIHEIWKKQVLPGNDYHVRKSRFVRLHTYLHAYLSFGRLWSNWNTNARCFLVHGRWQWTYSRYRMRVCVCYFLDQKLGGSISLHLRSLIKDTTVTCHAKNNAGKAQEVLEILVRYAPDRYHA